MFASRQAIAITIGALLYTPFVVASPVELETKATEELDKRGPGLLINTFSSGDCSSFGLPAFYFSGKCQNTMPHIYGANFGKPQNPWENCAVKFWELPNCHGHATEFHPDDFFGTGPDQYSGVYNGFYNCMAVANKQNKVYLGSGASSISVQC